MNPRLLPALLLLLSQSACEARPTPARDTSSMDVAGEVGAAFDSLVAAVVRLDVPATLAAYDTSTAFFHTADGVLVRTGAANEARIRGMFPTLKAIRDAVIDSTHMVPLGPDAVVLVAAFRETLVDTAGAAIPVRGIWTTIFRRQPAGWRVVAEHVSHLPQ